MAFDVSLLSTYSEKSAEVLYNGVLFSPGYTEFTMYQGINGIQLINFLDTTATEQSSNCSLSASGNTSLSNKTLTVGDFSFVNDFCTRDLDSYPFPVVPGVVYDSIEARFMDAITADLYQKIKQRIDLSLWQGTTAAGYLINGISYAVSACTSKHEISTYNQSAVTYSTGVTSSNINLVIDEILENITQDMLVDGPLTIYAPWSLYNLYTIWRSKNIGPQTMPEGGSVGLFEQWVLGREGQVRLKMEPGLTGTYNLICTNPKNIIIGTDIPAELEDFSNARFEYDNISRKLYHFLDFRLGVTVKDCSKFVTNF